MSLKEHGMDKYRQLIQQNISQVRYLVQLIKNTPELELCAPVPLNVVCFRYVTPGSSESEVDRINQEILVELQEQGTAVLSGSWINGKYVMRLGHTNHRSQREDFEVLVREVVRLGRKYLMD